MLREVSGGGAAKQGDTPQKIYPSPGTLINQKIGPHQGGGCIIRYADLYTFVYHAHEKERVQYSVANIVPLPGVTLFGRWYFIWPVG